MKSANDWEFRVFFYMIVDSMNDIANLLRAIPCIENIVDE
jgi:hypothetical protein